MKCQQLCNTSKPCYTEWCSPRDQGLGLMVPQGQKIKVLVLTLKSWGLSLELLVSVLVFMRNWTLSRLLKYAVISQLITLMLNIVLAPVTDWKFRTLHKCKNKFSFSLLGFYGNEHGRPWYLMRQQFTMLKPLFETIMHSMQISPSPECFQPWRLFGHTEQRYLTSFCLYCPNPAFCCYTK